MASKIKVDQIEGSTGSSITIPSGQTLTVTDGIASTSLTGTINDARLPTVPVSKGGTGLTSLGSANQVVKVNSGATGLEFGTVSSDFVKLATTTISSTVASISFDNFISATYHGYKIIYSGVKGNAHDDIFKVRFKSGGSTQTGSNYSLIQVRGYQQVGSSRGVDNDNYSSWGDTGLSIGHFIGASSTRGGFGFMYFYPANGTISSNVTGIHSYFHRGSIYNQFNSNHFSGNYLDVAAASGIEFSITGTSNLLAGGTFVLYGMKA